MVTNPKTTSDGSGEALQDALAAIEKSHGKGAIMRLGDRPNEPIAGISTGSIGLDLAAGGAGLPRGRVVEIYGPESSGKTTLTLHAVADAQRRGGTAAFIDAEHALDPQYAKKLGVNIEQLLISQPDHGEQALDICETLVRSGAIDIIVVDSVAALVPKAEIEGEMGDHFVGLQARLMSQALRKLTALVAKTNTCLIFINQIREKIGVMFGSPETTTGGRALKFYSSVRVDIRRIGAIKHAEIAVGARTKATVVKNKIAPPFRKVEFDILFNRGIDQNGELLDLGVEHGVLRRSGTWVSFGETRLGQGRERAREFLDEHPEVKEELRRSIFAKLGLPTGDAADGAEASAAKAEGQERNPAETRGERLPSKPAAGPAKRANGPAKGNGNGNRAAAGK
ncbi:MAG: recombinase RecA [Planctomycetota bacterium]